MGGVQNSWSKGLYLVGTVGIEKLISHLRDEASPILNDAIHNLGASIALAKVHTTNFTKQVNMLSEFCASTVLASR